MNLSVHFTFVLAGCFPWWRVLGWYLSSLGVDKAQTPLSPFFWRRHLLPFLLSSAMGCISLAVLFWNCSSWASMWLAGVFFCFHSVLLLALLCIVLEFIEHLECISKIREVLSIRFVCFSFSILFFKTGLLYSLGWSSVFKIYFLFYSLWKCQ